VDLEYVAGFDLIARFERLSVLGDAPVLERFMRFGTPLAQA
jgi:hypothetical protein